MSRVPPQPDPSRITPFAGHPIVVGVSFGQPEVVMWTAVELARALGVRLYFAYADPGRVVERELPHGRVQHADLNPDLVDDERWRQRDSALQGILARSLKDTQVAWEFRYLAGRADRALTHLARAVDAGLIVVGTRRPGGGGRMHELLQGSVGEHLSHHQHRPVLVVPTEVVDWKTPLQWG